MGCCRWQFVGDSPAATLHLLKRAIEFWIVRWFLNGFKILKLINIHPIIFINNTFLYTAYIYLQIFVSKLATARQADIGKGKYYITM